METEDSPHDVDRSANPSTKRPLFGQKGHANNQNDLETAGQPPQDVQLHNSECQVPGCGTVLWETLKRKVRICDVHRRALVLEMNGFQGRFCQQCSRVHDLSSFDGNRRGCRKRLRRRLYRLKNVSDKKDEMPARSSPSSPAVPAGSNKSLKTESTNDGTSGPYSSYWRVPPGMQSPTGMMPAMASWPVMARHSIPPFRVPPHLKGIIKSFDGADSRPPLAPASPSDTGHHPDDRRLQGVASTSTRACRDCPKSQKGDVATAIQKNCLSHTGNSNQRPLRWPKENTEGEPSIDEPFESYPQAFQAAYYGCEAVMAQHPGPHVCAGSSCRACRAFIFSVVMPARIDMMRSYQPY